MKIEIPKIPPELAEKTFDELFCAEDRMLEICRMTNDDASEQVIENVRLYHSVIKNCKFTDTDFHNVHLSDVRFENCDFSNLLPFLVW